MKKLFFSVLVLFFTLTAQDLYVLCEGNFQTPNASVWRLNPQNPEEPAYRWNWYYNATEPNGGNPLGDTGQHLALFENEMYVVCNNSHNIEYVKFIDDEPVHLQSIILNGTSPRSVMVDHENLYIASWGVSGILVLEKETFNITDTIPLPASPEDMVLNGDILYVSMIQDMVWNKYDGVAKINLITRQMVHEYKVVRGANKMTLNNNRLYITGTWFDESWNALTGTSVIDLNTDSVSTVEYGLTPNFSADILSANNSVYRLYKKNIFPVLADGNLADNPVLTNIAGEFETVYSIARFKNTWYVGITDDYMAPDYIRVYEENELIKEYTVGPMPRDFIFYKPSVTHINNRPLHADQFEINSCPNPFNGSVRIQCNLPANNGIINGFITDITGRMVHIFPSTYTEKTITEYVWEPVSQSSGIYIASFMFINGQKSYYLSIKLINMK